MSSQADLVRPAKVPNSPLRKEWRVGEFGMPVARYIDRDFARLEAEQFWPHVWQMAAREDQLPNPGDYVVYDILDQSIILVRQQDGSVKAFHNVCPHRGTALAIGEGRFQLDTITCTFHGWKWNIDGRNTYVLDPQEFKRGCLKPEDVALKPVKVEQWAGSIWINLDPDCAPLAEHMAPIKQMVDDLLMDQMKFHWHQHAVVNANWKVAQEAFMEAYHVAQTHPQVTRGFAWDDYTKIFDYQGLPKGHGIFQSGGRSSTGRLTREQLLAMDQDAQTDSIIRGMAYNYEGQDAQIQVEDMSLARSMRDRPIPEGSTVAEEFLRVLRAHYEGQGRPVPTIEALAKVADMHMFPHVTFLPAHANVLMYRVRPSPNNDPDWCLFDMYAFRSYPRGQQPPPWKTQICTSISDFSLIPSQDFISIPRVQKGLHSKGITHTLMGGRQEAEIWSMHRELDVYLETGRGS